MPGWTAILSTYGRSARSLSVHEGLRRDLQTAAVNFGGVNRKSFGDGQPSLTL